MLGSGLAGANICRHGRVGWRMEFVFSRTFSDIEGFLAGIIEIWEYVIVGF